MSLLLLLWGLTSTVSMTVDVTSTACLPSANSAAKSVASSEVIACLRRRCFGLCNQGFQATIGDSTGTLPAATAFHVAAPANGPSMAPTIMASTRLATAAATRQGSCRRAL